MSEIDELRQSLGERYDIDRDSIGEGGYGVVYSAYDRTLKRHVAIKRLKPKPHTTGNARETALHEAQKIAQIRSPNVVQIFDVIPENETGGHILVLEWIRGSDLQKWRASVAFDEAKFFKVAISLIAGLRDIHAAGLVHGDIKPSNVLIDANEIPKYTDFGLAVSMVEQGSPTYAGTLLYAAPEQLRSGGKADYRTDIYSLGAVLYYLFTGEHYLGDVVTDPDRTEKDIRDAIITEAPEPIARLIRVPNQMYDLIHEMLAKSPSDRPYSLEEIATRVKVFSPSRRDPHKTLLTEDLAQVIAPVRRHGFDYASRIENYFRAYLGTEKDPVPFVGRSSVMEELNEWLSASGAESYLMIVGEAGRGKSALLARWIHTLTQRDDVHVVFVPVSVRFNTALASVFFPLLVFQLSRFHPGAIPVQDYQKMGPDYMRDLALSIMQNYSDETGRQLLIVIDGLDEAADWEIGSDLFPVRPPKGVRVVVSARLKADDVGGEKWLRQLGWDVRGIANQTALRMLSQEEVGELVDQLFDLPMGATNRLETVRQLFRITEGDPLLVQLYASHFAAVATERHAIDLSKSVPGLDGFFDNWWEEQRRLWTTQGARPLQEKQVQAVLNLLSCALAPMPKETLLAVVPPEVELNTWTLSDALLPLMRLVLGDGINQDYVFSHPRLAYYFRERLTLSERNRWDSVLVEYGRQVIGQLTGSVDPDTAQDYRYAIMTYAAHLVRSHADTELIYGLVSERWMRIWRAFEGGYRGFLADVEVAWERAKSIDDVLMQTRCALVTSLVRAVSKNYDSTMVMDAVDVGLLSVQAALNLSHSLLDYDRGDLQGMLVPHFPEQRWELLARNSEQDNACAAFLRAIPIAFLAEIIDSEALETTIVYDVIDRLVDSVPNRDTYAQLVTRLLPGYIDYLKSTRRWGRIVKLAETGVLGGAEAGLPFIFEHWEYIEEALRTGEYHSLPTWVELWEAIPNVVVFRLLTDVAKNHIQLSRSHSIILWAGYWSETIAVPAAVLDEGQRIELVQLILDETKGEVLSRSRMLGFLSGLIDQNEFTSLVSSTLELALQAGMQGKREGYDALGTIAGFLTDEDINHAFETMYTANNARSGDGLHGSFEINLPIDRLTTTNRKYAIQNKLDVLADFGAATQYGAVRDALTESERRILLAQLMGQSVQLRLDAPLYFTLIRSFISDYPMPSIDTGIRVGRLLDLAEKSETIVELLDGASIAGGAFIKRVGQQIFQWGQTACKRGFEKHALMWFGCGTFEYLDTNAQDTLLEMVARLSSSELRSVQVLYRVWHVSLVSNPRLQEVAGQVLETALRQDITTAKLLTELSRIVAQETALSASGLLGFLEEHLQEILEIGELTGANLLEGILESLPFDSIEEALPMLKGSDALDRATSIVISRAREEKRNIPSTLFQHTITFGNSNPPRWLIVQLGCWLLEYAENLPTQSQLSAVRMVLYGLVEAYEKAVLQGGAFAFNESRPGREIWLRLELNSLSETVRAHVADVVEQHVTEQEFSDLDALLWMRLVAPFRRNSVSFPKTLEMALSAFSKTNDHKLPYVGASQVFPSLEFQSVLEEFARVAPESAYMVWKPTLMRFSSHYLFEFLPILSSLTPLVRRHVPFERRDEFKGNVFYIALDVISWNLPQNQQTLGALEQSLRG